MSVNQKGVVHLFVILLLLAGVGIGLYLVQHPAIFKPRADEAVADPSLCKASDAKSFGECLFLARINPTINRIEVTKQIICSSKTECTNIGSAGGFALQERTGSLTIFGTPGTNAGIKRINEYNYTLLGIGSNVSNLTLKDLIFDETTAYCRYIKAGTPDQLDDDCAGTLVLGSNIDNVTVENITILHSKGNAISVRQAKNLTIRKSIIFDAGGNGIWFDDGKKEDDYWCQHPDYNLVHLCPVDPNLVNRNIIIENNLIADSHIAGIEFYAYGESASKPSFIRNNIFTHNHKDSLYVVCPPPASNANPPVVGGHCPGGQLAFGRSEWLAIQDNIIRDGTIDEKKPNDPYFPAPGSAAQGGGEGKTFKELGLVSAGIELGGQIHNITILTNRIYGVEGNAIHADFTKNDGTTHNYDINNINIVRNQLYNNGNSFARRIVKEDGSITAVTNLNVPDFYLIDNIETQTSPPAQPLPQAFIFADPPICESNNTSGQCQSTIRWYSNDYSGITTTIKGDGNPPYTETSGQANGAQNPDWIPQVGATFQLRDANKAIIPGAETLVFSTPRTSINANPNPCIPDGSGKPCTAHIYLNANGYNNLQVFSGTQAITGPNIGAHAFFDFPWVTAAGATLELRSNNQKIGSVFIAGIEGGSPPPSSPSPSIPSATPSTSPSPVNPPISNLITASPNPCTLGSNGLCFTVIKLNAAGRNNLQILANDNPMTGIGVDPTGTFPTGEWISATGVTFKLKSDGVEIGSIMVKGIH